MGAAQLPWQHLFMIVAIAIHGYRLIKCQVLEHLVRPLEDFRKIAALGADWIVTSTELHPGSKPAADWPYLSVESGQHVAFYRPDTLERLGRETGYPHVMSGPFFQIFARKPFPAWKWQTAVELGRIVFPFVKKWRPSLTVSDCERVGLRVLSVKRRDLAVEKDEIGRNCHTLPLSSVCLKATSCGKCAETCDDISAI